MLKLFSEFDIVDEEEALLLESISGENKNEKVKKKKKINPIITKSYKKTSSR